MVKAMLACPRRSLTTFTGTLSLMRSDPWVWRGSRSRITGSSHRKSCCGTRTSWSASGTAEPLKRDARSTRRDVEEGEHYVGQPTRCGVHRHVLLALEHGDPGVR